MARFSRATIIEALTLVEGWSHSSIDRFLLEFGLEDIVPVRNPSPNKEHKANCAIKHLLANPEATGPKGSHLDLEVVEHIIEKFWRPPDPWSDASLRSLSNALARDGFAIVDGELIPTMPTAAGLAQKGNELESLLDKFSCSVAKGHLDQALSAHTRSDWAACNSQLRSFFESLVDAFADRVLRQPAVGKTTFQKMELLAKTNPPFILPDYNEWEIGKNSGFIQGFWKRLHPHGSHAGLSDQADSTFRLHLVIVVAHHLLKRYERWPL